MRGVCACVVCVVCVCVCMEWMGETVRTCLTRDTALANDKKTVGLLMVSNDLKTLLDFTFLRPPICLSICSYFVFVSEYAGIAA